MGHQGSGVIQSRAHVQRPMRLPVEYPLIKFTKTQKLFCLYNRTPTDSGQHQFVPNFVGQRQAFGLFTSLMASTNAHAKDGCKS